MVTHDYIIYNIDPFWDDSFKNLTYIREEFNDHLSVDQWLSVGYADKFTGDMCDMRSPQPPWNNKIIRLFEERGWKDVGTSYYRMHPGTILPVHGDLFTRYINIFNLHGHAHTIRRAVIFLEDWSSGHYLEIMERPIVSWRAGDVVEWTYDTPHMAANMGLRDRYTLQVTGHL